MKISAVLATLFAVLSIGCSGSKPGPLVGTWKLDESTGAYKNMPEGKRQRVTAEFKADNTFSFEVKSGEVVNVIEGSYKLEGDKLTMTPSTQNGKAAKEPPLTVTLAKDKKSFDMPQGAGRIVKQ